VLVSKQKYPNSGAMLPNRPSLQEDSVYDSLVETLINIRPLGSA
jgi:hypothetical protein